MERFRWTEEKPEMVDEEKASDDDYARNAAQEVDELAAQMRLLPFFV